MAELTLKLGKCTFGTNKLVFLGHVVTGECIKPSPTKTATIWDFPLPKSLKEAWLGICNWYCRFIKGFAEIAVPWVELTKKEN